MPYSSIAYIIAHRLGDALFQTPAIRQLKSAIPGISISIIAPSAASYAVFEGNPDIDALYDASSSIPEALKGRTFDLTMSNCSKRFAIPICKSINGPQLFPAGLGEIRSKEKEPSLAIDLQHSCVSALESLCASLQISSTCNDYSYTLPFTKQDELQVDRILKQLDVSNRTLIGLHLGCRSVRKHLSFLKSDITHKKAWRLNEATRFCQLLSEKHPEIRCLATGTQAEGIFTKKLAKVCPNVIDVVDLFSIKEAAALMHRLQTYVVTDTGMLHVASTTPVHIVGLYAVTNPAITGPSPGRTAHTAIQRDSMDAITGDMVFDAVHTALTT